MEIIDAVVRFISSGNLVVFFTKLFGIALGGLYLFFSLIMVQQTITLKKVIKVNDRGVLLLLSQIQLVAAIGILLYAVVIL